jgi:hypothetical protein
MDRPIWHIVWNTKGAWPPHDARGDWAPLAGFFAPLIAAGFVSPSYPLCSRYLSQSCASIVLSEEEMRTVCDCMSKLMEEGGDRIAGNHYLLATGLLPTQVYALFECDRCSLSQVVGRLKSRLATLLSFQFKPRKHARVWGKGFWAAELVDPSITAQVQAFIDSMAKVKL